MDLLNITKINELTDKEKLKKIEKQVHEMSTSIMDNKYVMTIAIMFVVLYGRYAAPNLSEYWTKLFESKIFKLFILFLIGYITTKDYGIAFVSAMIFNIAMQLSEK